jgi:alpha-galactosidase
MAFKQIRVGQLYFQFRKFRSYRLWLTNYISDFLKKEGIDVYRQDFNIDPKIYWSLNDAPDRIGITEIKHIEGLYAFWDSLLVRFPI